MSTFSLQLSSIKRELLELLFHYIAVTIANIKKFKSVWMKFGLIHSDLPSSSIMETLAVGTVTFTNSSLVDIDAVKNSISSGCESSTMLNLTVTTLMDEFSVND